MSTEIKSKDWCPTCLLQNKVQNPLKNRPGQFYTNCDAGHQFNDTDELNTLRAQARSKFPALYQSSAPKIDLDALSGLDIVINLEVKKAIEELVGQPITSGSDLKGLMYAYISDNKDKESELRTLRASLAMAGKRAAAAGSGGSAVALMPGQFIVTAPEWALEGIAGQAQYQGKTPQEWVGEEFNNYFETYFGAPVQQ